jgi:CRISPR-associated protein Csd2
MTTGKSEEGEEGPTSAAKKGGKKAQKLWNCGQVRGPVQMGFAQSQSRILDLEHTITRAALTNAGDTDRVSSGEDNEKAASGQMGRKHTVPYALYRAHGFISPFLAKDTGISQADLELLFQALSNLFELDRSAARGEMSVRGLYVFEHELPLGNAPSHQLFDMLRVSGPPVARSFGEYSVSPPQPEELPSGVTLKRVV